MNEESYQQQPLILVNTKKMIEQTKTNFDIINLSNACGVCMATAMNLLDKMSNSKLQLPNLRKIQKLKV